MSKNAIFSSGMFCASAAVAAIGSAGAAAALLVTMLEIKKVAR